MTPRWVDSRGISEKEFEQSVIDMARFLGWLAYHTRDSRRSAAGFPDITAVHPEHGVIFAELKVGKRMATPDQVQWLETLDAAGANVWLWRPSQWSSIEGILKRGPNYPNGGWR